MANGMQTSYVLITLPYPLPPTCTKDIVSLLQKGMLTHEKKVLNLVVYNNVSMSVIVFISTLFLFQLFLTRSKYFYSSNPTILDYQTYVLQGMWIQV